MTIINKNIAKYDLIKPANFAKLYIKSDNKETGRKYIYDLIQRGKIDFTEIDGTKFIIMNEKTSNFIRYDLK